MFHDKIYRMLNILIIVIFGVRRIRKYLSQETTGSLVHAFITFGIDYCNGLLYGLPNNQLAKIQRVLGVLLLGWYVMRLSFVILHQ